jgi:hypothetical protein
MTSLGQFQIVIHPIAPGICRGCGTPYGNREMVDTGLNSEGCFRPHWDEHKSEVVQPSADETAGAIYFCESCVINMGELVQMLSYEKARVLSERLEDLEKENAKLERENLGLEKILDGYRTFTGESGSNARTSVPVNVAQDAEEATEPFTFEQSDVHAPSGADSGDSEIDESLNLTEHSGLSRDSGSKPGNGGDEPITDEPESNRPTGGLGF